MAPVMGSVFMLILFTLLQFFLLLVTRPIRGCHPRFTRLWVRSKEDLMWNFTLRLIMQAALELSFSCLLNFPYLYRLKSAAGFFEATDYLVTALVGACIVIMPIWIAIFYNVKFD
jgi:hypothetical protein